MNILKTMIIQVIVDPEDDKICGKCIYLNTSGKYCTLFTTNLKEASSKLQRCKGCIFSGEEKMVHVPFMAIKGYE